MAWLPWRPEATRKATPTDALRRAGRSRFRARWIALSHPRRAISSCSAAYRSVTRERLPPGRARRRAWCGRPQDAVSAGRRHTKPAGDIGQLRVRSIRPPRDGLHLHGAVPGPRRQGQVVALGGLCSRRRSYSTFQAASPVCDAPPAKDVLPCCTGGRGTDSARCSRQPVSVPAAC